MTERAIDHRLRDKFFPDAKQSQELNYALIHDGKVTHRNSILKLSEGTPGLAGSAGRFQVTPDNRLFVVYLAAGTDEQGAQVFENRVVEIMPDGTSGVSATIPLRQPFTSFFTATVRAGSSPSWTLEMLGPRADRPKTLSYARVSLTQP